MNPFSSAWTLVLEDLAGSAGSFAQGPAVVMKHAIKSGLRFLGYELHRVRAIPDRQPEAPVDVPPALDPVWPLPRRPGGMSDQQIREAFGRYRYWHYGYEFEGGLSFSPHHLHPNDLSEAPRRPLQRFRHFMPHLVAAVGSLEGKRVLDIACNSGFWSLQCALLGAEVVGFDARPELIEQAELIKSIVGLSNAEFRVLDFDRMNPETLGRFDIVLNLGLLYHLPEPVAALRSTIAMSRGWVLLDTELATSIEPVLRVYWEEPIDIRDASTPGIVCFPSKSAIGLILRHLGVRESREIPLCTPDMPADYRNGARASWLIRT
jgi:SAM-dependent methyltransferase